MKQLSRKLFIAFLPMLFIASAIVKADEPPRALPSKPLEKKSLIYQAGDSEFRFTTRAKPEFFYGRNLRLLNNEVEFDRVVYFRHTLDFNAEYHFGHESRGYDVVLGKINIRNRNIWGDPESIFATTSQTIKDNEVVFGDHRHSIARLLLWIRELWLRVCLNDVFDYLPFCNRHYLTIGAFPFELGRGISLGSAYAVNPESFLGYRSETSIDQYAFGLKLEGDIYRKYLTYDLYFALLDNKASKFDYTGQKIRGNEYGRKFDQYRGFGILNYVLAGRARWTPMDGPGRRIVMEPYWLFNDDREQRVAFLGDARSRLGTLGLAGEFELGNLGFGFDTAFNKGHQCVKGIDRNIIRHENRNGLVAIVNSNVRQNGQRALYLPENQTIINRAIESSSENGQVIGENSLGVLTNSADRFRDPYINLYEGSMFVFDIGYYINKPRLQINATVGYASGDENPNADLSYPGEAEEDGEYEGFVGIMESYVGKRVKSAFLLNGSGKIPRVLSFPSEEVIDTQVYSVSKFTNLLFTGVGFDILPPFHRKWVFNPNILGYWQDNPTRILARFNPVANADNEIPTVPTEVAARKFLGTEVNLFSGVELVPDLKFWFIGAIFFPGSHYDDIKGRPLNREQREFLDRQDRTGVIRDRVPLIGNDKSYFFDFGLDYLF